MTKGFVFQIEQEDDTLVAVCHKPEMATHRKIKPKTLQSILKQVEIPVEELMENV